MKTGFGLRGTWFLLKIGSFDATDENVVADVCEDAEPMDEREHRDEVEYVLGERGMNLAAASWSVRCVIWLVCKDSVCESVCTPAST